jgi:LysR family hydrogen peroxide-inducible transcriptional activator
MELHQLRYFVAAAECANISRAAQRCNVAQPSLSQQIKKLECSLNVKLFDRIGRGIVITDAGKALLPRARQILSQVNETAASLARESGGSGSLAIGAIPTIAPYLLPAALGKLHAMSPACDLSVREDLTENLVRSLLENEIDCALLSTPLEEDGVELEVLGEEELLIAVPASHAVAGEKQITIGALRGEPMISLEEVHCLGRQIEGFCSARHWSRRVVCRTTQMLTILEMVAVGVGVSIVPAMTAAADRTGRCRYIPLRPGKPTRQIALAWRRGRSKPAAARAFAGIVKKQLFA